jgi:hypothetical protein
MKQGGQMGVKDWFAKNVAGAGGYGDVMGRSTAENGLALGRTLYLGHGILPGKSIQCVFEDADSMISKGYTVYCVNPSEPPPSADPSKLSVLTRAAGVAFAARVAMNAANCFRKPENPTNFRRSLGASNAAFLKQNSNDVPMELLTHFVRMELPRTVTKALDLARPGTGDMFGAILLEVSRQNQMGSAGFQRRGIVGFDTWAVSLAEETVSSVQKAAQEFGW